MTSYDLKIERRMTSYDLKTVIENYDLLLIDLWGVVYDGLNSYPGVVNTVNQIIKENKKIIFLSNTPRPNNVPYIKLKELGLNIDLTQIYTSGDLVREQLQSFDDEIFKNLGRKLYHLGSEVNKDILKNIDIEEVDNINHADFILLTIYIEQNEDITKYDELFNLAKSKNIPAICANPDKIAMHGAGIRYCAGSFAARYADIGGIVHYYGKPDARIYNKVINKFKIEKSEILMIGDTIETDVKGAKSAGIDSLLVKTGNGINYSESSSIKPTWILPSLNF